MFLSKNKKTHGRFYLYYFDDIGKRRSVTTGTSYKKEALEFLIAFTNKLNEIKPVNPTLKPLENLIDLETNVISYVNNNLRKGTVNIYKSTFKTFKIIIGNKPLNEISIKDIEYFKSCRLKEVSPST